MLEIVNSPHPSETIPEPEAGRVQRLLRMGHLAAQRVIGRHEQDANATASPEVTALPNPFEYEHFVRPAPSLAEVAKDTHERTTPFSYLPQERHVTADKIRGTTAHPEAITSTEGEGIIKLLAFLNQVDSAIDKIPIDQTEVNRLASLSGTERVLVGYTAYDLPDSQTDVKPWLHRKIESLKDTAFIGSQEFSEATAGLAQYWKSYLQEDAERQICLPEIEAGKSAAYVLEHVLSNFTDEELAAMHGRVIENIADLTAPADKAKIVLLDDWVMSGDQIHMRERTMWQRFGFDKRHLKEPFGEKYLDSVEINLLAADETRLEEGSTYPQSRSIPVKAYFKAPLAREAEDSGNENERYHARITGVHSSVDNHFSSTISNIITIMNTATENPDAHPPYVMPPLTNIVRTYRNLEPVRAQALFHTPEKPLAEKDKLPLQPSTTPHR